MTGEETGLPERFANKLTKVAYGDRECWEFSGRLHKSGYSYMSWCGKIIRTNRLAMVLSGGKLDGLLVRHACDNKRCCNPSHLLTGTDQDNKNDCVLRHRHAAGERSSNHKLNNRKVAVIRRLYASGDMTQQDIANIFHVGRACVAKVVQFASWNESRLPIVNNKKTKWYPKFTPQKAEEVFLEYQAGGHTTHTLAKKHHINQGSVCKIVGGAYR